MFVFNMEENSVKNSTEENVWIMDSGASAHMTFKRDFVEFQECVRKYLSSGNQHSLEVLQKGSVLIKRWETGVLHEVLYVPNLKINLFS